MMETKKIRNKKQLNSADPTVSESRRARLLRLAFSRGGAGLLAVACCIPVAAESSLVPKLLPRRSKAISISPPREEVRAASSDNIQLVFEAPKVLIVPKLPPAASCVVSPVKLDNADVETVSDESLKIQPTAGPSSHLAAELAADDDPIVLVQTDVEALPDSEPYELPPPSPNPFPGNERRTPERIEESLPQSMPIPPEPRASQPLPSEPLPSEPSPAEPLPAESQTYEPQVSEAQPYEIQAPAAPMTAPEPFFPETRGQETQDDLRFRPAPISQPQGTVVADSPSHWMDIRPRSIGENGGALFTEDKLPPDMSGLPQQSSTPRLIQLYQADLLMRDIWPAASFCHRPLHFEDPYLERYGTKGCLTSHCPSLHSGAHFIWKAGLLPLSVALDPPHDYVRSGFKTPRVRRIVK